MQRAALLVILVGCGTSTPGAPAMIDAAVDAAVIDGAVVDAEGQAADAAPAAVDASMTTEIQACDDLAFESSIRLIPAQAGERYLRCATRGPERGAIAAISPTGEHVAVITTSGTVRLFATRPWDEVAQLGAAIGAIDAIAFSPDGATLATLSAEMGVVALWSTELGDRKLSYRDTPADMVDTWAASLAFSPSGRHLATSLGTVIDLETGVIARRFDGGANRRLVFAGEDAVVVDLSYRVGNSPGSRRLFVVDRRTGAQVELFRFYERALLGYAISADASRIAIGRTDEVIGAEPGLYVLDAAGAVIAGDAAFTGTVLGFSRDGATLFTSEGGAVVLRDARDLHAIRSFVWFDAGAHLVGLSPDDEVVVSGDGATRWWDTRTGALVATRTHALTSVAWSADGRVGVGAGDPAAMFALWREAETATLCAPAGIGGAAPALDSLGTVMDAEGNATSADGATALRTVFEIHTHATDYERVEVVDTATGAVVRVFAPTAPGREVVMSAPDAAELYTREGDAVATWCETIAPE